MLLGAEVTWPQVALALVATLPACISAYYGRRASLNSRESRTELATENGKTVGVMVTEIHGAASREATQYDTHGEAGGR